ncbi:MAG: RNA polymerase sigma-70 factor [Alistipes sp.]
MDTADKITALSAAEFGLLFTHYRPRFTLIARRYVRDEAAAEDIVSDSFMAFWDANGKLPPPLPAEKPNYPAYILTIVRNKCLDYLRARNRHTEIEHHIQKLHQQVVETDIRSLEALDPGALFCGELSAIVQHSLDALPQLTREVFVARRFDDMPYREIAQKYDITERRVEFELEKAIRQLRVALKDYLPALLIWL